MTDRKSNQEILAELDQCGNAVTRGVLKDVCVSRLRDATVEIERLRARERELVGALVFIEGRSRQPGEGITEHYERIAEDFMYETGMMAPGKDDAAGYHSQEARREAWEEFCAEPIKAVRGALTLTPERQT